MTHSFVYLLRTTITILQRLRFSYKPDIERNLTAIYLRRSVRRKLSPFSISFPTSKYSPICNRSGTNSTQQFPHHSNHKQNVRTHIVPMIPSTPSDIFDTSCRSPLVFVLAACTIMFTLYIFDLRELYVNNLCRLIKFPLHFFLRYK